MKKFALQILSLLLLCVMQACTSDEPSDPDSGQEISPDEKVPDPTGTVLLSMRDADNGSTSLNGIYIRNENFTSGYSSGVCSFVDLGPVNGLGNVSYIPKEGWASQVMVVPGHGYVARVYGKYYRIYVIDYAYSTMGGIIGADIKYQTPFYGADEEILLDKTQIILKKSEAEVYRFSSYITQNLYYPEIQLLSQVAVDVDCQFASSVYETANCSFSFSSSSIYNIGSCTILKFYVDLRSPFHESLTSFTEIGTITLSTGYGKSKTVKVYFDPTK